MAALLLPIVIALTSIVSVSHGQTISTACSSSMISSFTPCLNFVTGSSGRGSSPTKDCCGALKSLMENNMDCACLIVTGNVPVSIPFINTNLGSVLPRACKSSIPLQCKSSGVPLPAPGPVLFAPPPPPPPPAHAPGIHAPTPVQAHSPKGSKAATVAAPPPAGNSGIEPAAASHPKFPLGPTADVGIRPMVNNSSTSNILPLSLSYLIITFAAIIAFKF